MTLWTLTCGPCPSTFDHDTVLTLVTRTVLSQVERQRKRPQKRVGEHLSLSAPSPLPLQPLKYSISTASIAVSPLLVLHQFTQRPSWPRPSLLLRLRQHTAIDIDPTDHNRRHAPNTLGLQGPQEPGPLPIPRLHYHISRRRLSDPQEEPCDDAVTNHHSCSVSQPPKAAESLNVGGSTTICIKLTTNSQVREQPSRGLGADKDRSHVQPLVHNNGPEMDDSYVLVLNPLVSLLILMSW